MILYVQSRLPFGDVVMCGAVMRCIDYSPGSRMDGLGAHRASCIVDLGVPTHAFVAIATVLDLELKKGRYSKFKRETQHFTVHSKSIRLS